MPISVPLFLTGCTQHAAVNDLNLLKRLGQRRKELHLIAIINKQILERPEALHIFWQAVPVARLDAELTQMNEELTIFRNRCQPAATKEHKFLQALWGVWVLPTQHPARIP
jgi:hypothetical protein